MQLLSVNAGQPQIFSWQGRQVRTGIFKTPVAGPVAVAADNLAGDGQADLRVHGGPNKAVYAYPHEHYAYWQAQPLRVPLTPGVFGENLTTQGLLENQVQLGDCFRVGTAVLLAAQPRMPCFKLGLRFDDAGMLARFQAAGRSGIYFRVREPGVVQAGDPIVLLEPGALGVTVQDAVDAFYHPAPDAARLQALLAAPFLPKFLKTRYRSLLKKAI